MACPRLYNLQNWCNRYQKVQMVYLDMAIDYCSALGTGRRRKWVSVNAIHRASKVKKSIYTGTVEEHWERLMNSNNYVSRCNSIDRDIDIHIHLKAAHDRRSRSIYKTDDLLDIVMHHYWELFVYIIQSKLNVHQLLT